MVECESNHKGQVCFLKWKSKISARGAPAQTHKSFHFQNILGGLNININFGENWQDASLKTLTNRRTYVLLVSIFENALTKVFNRQKRHFGH